MLGFNMSQQINFRRDINMTRLLADLIEDNKGKTLTFFLTNGFQLHGILLDSDEVHLKIRTNDYGACTKNVLVSHSAVSTVVPCYLK